ncbi:MAG: prolipoprotein diacylglyceryl transferase [Nitrospira sp.]|nr:prolipoprotein diacylglyceryl transferase [Nitrospira sp.]
MAVHDVAAALLILLYAALFRWAFRVLPREGWQVLATVPQARRPDGRWMGLNLTYYGAFTASAVVLAVALAIVLLGSVAVPFDAILGLSVTLLGACVPAAKILARLIEGKTNTFTIGGASMFGLFLAPWIVAAMNAGFTASEDDVLPMTAVLATVAIAYAFGEGTGRLACLSFGCCYGAPLNRSHPWIAGLFVHHHTAFAGETRKAAYESGLESVPLVPIQAMTAVVSVAAGMAGLWLFFRGRMAAAFLFTVVVTQMWRVGSECLRADYLGGRRVSWYQVLSLAGIAYAAFLAFWLTDVPSVPPDALRGIRLLWHPGVILCLQGLWLGLFFFTGRSRVTTATLSMHVVKDRI